MSIKSFIKKNKKWLLLVCVGIVAALGTIVVVVAPILSERQAELEAEQRFNELLEQARAAPAEPAPAARAPPEDAGSEESLFINIIPEIPVQEEIILLTPEEKLAVLYEAYGIIVPDKNLDFSVLHGVNEHIYAWIYIPGTRVNYPVLQHPTDETFYLHHNLDGSFGYPGCIYTEHFNTMTFMDRMTVVYGHNMRNGTMFADLHNFADARFFEDNRYIFVYTEDDIFVYRIFSARQTGHYHILFAYGLHQDEGFLNYLDMVTDAETVNGVVDDTIEFTADSRIIALSTCVAGRPTERFVVHGLLIEHEGFYR